MTNRRRLAALLSVLLLGVTLTGCEFKVKEEYSGSRWYQDYSAPELEAEMLSPVSSDSVATSWTYGIPEGDTIASDDSYYYMGNPTDENKVYRIKKGTYENELLCDVPASLVLTVDDKLVFQNTYTDSGYETGIYMMNKDGSDMILLTDDIVTNLCAVNEWIYYTDNGFNKLYKMNVNTKDSFTLYEGDLTTFAIHENTIYVPILKDSYNYEYVIATMDVNGENFHEDWEQNYVLGMHYVDGMLYYTDWVDEEFYEVDPVSLYAECIYDDIDCYFSVRPRYYDGWVFYVDQTEQYSLVAYNRYADETYETNVYNCTDMEVFDGMLMVYYTDNQEPCVRVNNISDGSSVRFFQ